MQANEPPLAGVDRCAIRPPGSTRSTCCPRAYGHPDRAFGVEADAVGTDGASAAKTRQFASAPSAPTSKAPSRRAKVSATMSVRPSGVITDAVREEGSSAATSPRGRRDRRGRCRCCARRVGQSLIEAEVADVGAAVGVHHHVVAVAVRERGEIGVEVRAPCRRTAAAAIEHRDDQQLALRVQPSPDGRCGTSTMVRSRPSRSTVATLWV